MIPELVFHCLAHNFSQFNDRSFPSTKEKRGGTEAVMNWIICTIKLLRKLNDRLTETILVWDTFSAAEGDISYFSDLCSTYPDPTRGHVRRSLIATKSSFEELKALNRRVRRLEENCIKEADFVRTLPLLSVFAANSISLVFA